MDNSDENFYCSCQFFKKLNFGQINFCLWIYVIFLFFPSIVFSHSQNITQIGRYSTVINKPTQAQIDPLSAVSQYKFPDSVKTVGQAVQMVLENTGYQLAPQEQLLNSVKETSGKTLPITDRILGPLSVKETLCVLMGEKVYRVVCNPLHRTINFKLKSGFAKA